LGGKYGTYDVLSSQGNPYTARTRDKSCPREAIWVFGVTPSGKLAAGAGLQIGFKGNGFCFIREGNAGFNALRAHLECVRTTTLVVFCELVVQVFCDANVVGG
jgi:hypothetical protein